MTEQEKKLEADLVKARLRFGCPTWTIKDQYNDPDAPYFVSAFFLSGGQFVRLISPASDSNGGFEKNVDNGEQSVST